MTRQQVANSLLLRDTARANLLVNGGFEIWQRGPGPFAASLYNADRWFAAAGTGGTTFNSTIARDSANADIGSNYCWTCNHTLVGTISTLQQPVEIGNNLKGRTVTFSIRVKASAAVPNACAVQIVDVDDTTVIATSSSVSLTTSYQTISVSGTSTLNAASATSKLRCFILLQATATYYIDNAMLVVGSVPADYAPLHPADELARCLRYYEVIGQSTYDTVFQGYEPGAAAWRCYLPWKAQKAVTPTVTKNGTWSVSNCGQPVIFAPGVNSTQVTITALGAGEFFAQNSAASQNITVEANP